MTVRRPEAASAGVALPATVPAAVADTTFGALVIGGDSEAAAGPDVAVDALARRVQALCAAGVHVALVGRRCAVARPSTRAVGPGRLLVCRGADDVARAARWLARRGVTGRLVLLVGEAFGPRDGAPGPDLVMLVDELARAPVISVGEETSGCPARVVQAGGGSARLLDIVDTQLARHRDRRVPSIDADPAWLVRLPTEPHAGRVAEALGALANGWAGTRASLEEDGDAALPLFAVGGVYTGGPETELLAGPRWDRLTITADDDGRGRGVDAAPVERAVDLRTGVLVRHGPTGVRTLRLVSAGRPEALALRAEGPADALQAGPGPVAPSGPDPAPAFERRRHRGADVARVHAPGGGGIATAVQDRDHRVGDRRVVERLAAWCASPSGPPTWSSATDALDELERAGFDRLLSEHRAAWADRWADAGVRIDGAPDDQLAARFAVFHLLASAPARGEAAVGARGLTGRAYGGHVFWDADVFVLPALAALRPTAARAMLEYRRRRLPATRSAAARLGRAGARFPWESAGDGRDVTPSHLHGQHGAIVPIVTGEEQEHIVGDVAWAACRYAAWTGDGGFLDGPGRPLVVETARWWASGIRVDDTGRAHIDGVMGPDEYHPVVDDNVYTNVLARWNLRRAAELVEGTGATGDDREEAVRWRRMADALVDGFDPDRGLHEQFAGYWDLEPLLAAEVATPPFAADLLLGADRVAGSQLLKQADVVMAHHVLPAEMAPGSLAADLAWYEPRTAHGSSLSPAIYAAQLARAGRADDALDLFRLAAQLDVADLTGTTAGGLHLATMGGVWQALAHGFLGLDPTGDALGVDPRLPAAWEALELRFRYRGRRVVVRADHDRLLVTCPAPLSVRRADGRVERCAPPSTALEMGTST